MERTVPRAWRMTAALVTLVTLAAHATAGPDWKEGSLNTGDAGSLIDDAQVPHGQEPFSALETITGGLSDAFLLGGDEQDMYLIYIFSPPDFGALANPPVAGPQDFDTSLWLFNASGFGILGNDGIDDASGFPAFSNDGSGAGVTAPGFYYIALSGTPSAPLDSAGAPLFAFATPGEVSGPDGLGGGNPVASWSAAGSFGGYVIHLFGSVFVPCEGDATMDGLVNVEDLIEIVVNWGTCPPGGPCPADVTGDGEVGVADLIEVIQNWETCVPDFPPV